MKTIRFLYRCRKCGEVTKDSATGGKSCLDGRILSYVHAAIDGTVTEAMAPRMIGTHCCQTEPVSIGVTDFIGCEGEETRPCDPVKPLNLSDHAPQRADGPCPAGFADWDQYVTFTENGGCEMSPPAQGGRWMKDAEIIKYATAFRRGIVGIKGNAASMCYAMCWPLQSWLQVPTELVEVHFPESNHYFLRLEDGRILDPTADQFGHGLPPVYLGPMPGLYEEWIAEAATSPLTPAGAG